MEGVGRICPLGSLGGGFICRGVCFPVPAVRLSGFGVLGKQASSSRICQVIYVHMCDRPDGVLVLMLQAMRTSRRSQTKGWLL